MLTADSQSVCASCTRGALGQAHWLEGRDGSSHHGPRAFNYASELIYPLRAEGDWKWLPLRAGMFYGGLGWRRRRRQTGGAKAAEQQTARVIVSFAPPLARKWKPTDIRRKCEFGGKLS